MASIKAMVDLRAAIRKKYGDEALVPTEDESVPIPVIPTGSILLDVALGIGGFPRGRLIELYGAPSSGKSTLALSTAAQAQKMGGHVLYLDHEHAFDPTYAEVIGVDLSEDKWTLAQPSTAEEGLGIAEMFIENKMAILVIGDSLAAMVPKKQLEGEIGDIYVAIKARLMSTTLERLTPKISKAGAVFLFINHTREIINTMPGRTKKKTTPGGTALKFYSSIRVEVIPIESIKGKVVNPVSGLQEDGNQAIKVKAIVVKNKTSRPFRSGTFYLENGLCEARTILEVAVARGIVAQNGSRFVLPFTTEGTDKRVNIAGKEGTLQWLKDNPDKYERLRCKIIEVLQTKVDAEPIVDIDDEKKEVSFMATALSEEV